MKDWYSYGEEVYRQKQSMLTKLSWQRGDHDFLIKRVTRICARKECTNTFKTIPSDPKKHCSQSCSAIVNNTGRLLSEETKSKISIKLGGNGYVKRNEFCLCCNIILKERHKIKYCSLKCMVNYHHEKWVERWKRGEVNGSVGITTRNISGPLKRYLHEKFNNKCFKCGWSEKHPITAKVPLEIEHIDGNSENNKEENLTLLCPNCHALTPFYKNLNRGNGRKWRMDKYIKNVA